MKKRLLKTLQPLASKMPLNWLLKITGQRLFLPFYHSVQKDKPLPHISHLYDLRTTKEFERDIDYLLKYYTPVSLQELFEQLKSGKPFDKNTFFLSFDDGLREVYDLVAPILTRKGVPATIFLNSAFVDNKDLFFRYKASLIIEWLEIVGPSKSNKSFLLNKLGNADFKNAILRLSYQQRFILDEIANHLEIDFENFLKTEQPYLTTEQIKRLSEKGFTFGSHSVDHPLYENIALEMQIHQTKESQRFINQNFKQDIKAFAFPFTDHGVSSEFFNTVQIEKIADLTFGTAGLKNDSTPFHLQRFPVEEFPFQMHELVPAEYFYYIGKSFLGKNNLDRK